MKNPAKSMFLKSFKSFVFDVAIFDVFPLFQRPANLKNIVYLRVARCDNRPRLSVSQILKGLCHAILGNFGTDQLVIKLTEISQ